MEAADRVLSCSSGGDQCRGTERKTVEEIHSLPLQEYIFWEGDAPEVGPIERRALPDCLDPPIICPDGAEEEQVSLNQLMEEVRSWYEGEEEGPENEAGIEWQ